MDKTVEELLSDRISDGLEELANLTVGSEEYASAVDAINKLAKTRNDNIKIEYDDDSNRSKIRNDKELRERDADLKELQFKHEQEVHKLDVEIRERQLKSEKYKTWIEVVLSVGGIAAWYMMNHKVMRFEETGSIRSKAFQGTRMPKINLSFLKK